MASKKKTSPFRGLINLIAKLPWWVNVALALALYWGLHQVASQPGVLGSSGMRQGQMGTRLLHTMWKTLAGAGQYLLPLLFLSGAGVAFWRRHERRGLVSQVLHSPAADALDGMTWQQFELLVGEVFRLQGYAVTEVGGGGADGGVDLVLRKGNEKFLVQCKQWKAFRVGVDVVRELYGVMAATGAAGGFVVTSGRFTPDAANFASGRNVKLVDGHHLHQLIEKVRGVKAKNRGRSADTRLR